MKHIASLTALLILLFSGYHCFGQFTKLFDFENVETGVYPFYVAPVADADYLYGTASGAGVNGNGVVFKIKKDGTDYSVILDFPEGEGEHPEGGVIFVGDYLYGTTKGGGVNDNGTIYRVKPDGSDFSTVASFDEDIQGREPHQKLYYDGTMLYGSATQGGVYNAGTIFRLSSDGSNFTSIHDFQVSVDSGYSPNCYLISDGSYLYGMTTGGGSYSLGVIFRIMPDGSDYAEILDFDDDVSGAWGYAGVVYDGGEYLYGMTNNGGEENLGTIFKIKTDGTDYQTLLNMDDDTGGQPLGALVLSGTTLYGMAELYGPGGDGNGTMFSIGTDGSDFTVLIDFNGPNGGLPFGSLLYEDNVLYGVTNSGGNFGYGVIFKYALSGTKVESKYTTTDITIYPNPANELSTLQLTPETLGQDLQIFNSQGVIVRSQKITSVNATIDIHGFSAGVYTLRIGATTKRLVVE